MREGYVITCVFLFLLRSFSKKKFVAEGRLYFILSNMEVKKDRITFM